MTAQNNQVQKKETAVVKKENDNKDVIASIVLNNNIAKMNQEQKVNYYQQLCYSLELNPLTQPFQILTLQGKEILYATKSCTEQLRKINGVSIDNITQKIEKDIIVTTVTVHDKSGRTDGATGAVNAKGLSGDALANAMMKSETKAKRRATLSICGLGMLDESEIETIPGSVVHNIFSNPEKEQECIDITVNHEEYEITANKIESAQSVKNLNAIGQWLKTMNFSQDQLLDLRERYKFRLNKLMELEKNK